LHNLSKKPAVAPLSIQESPLAFNIIPAILEKSLPLAATPSELVSDQSGEALIDFLPDEGKWIVSGEDSLFASLEAVKKEFPNPPAEEVPDNVSEPASPEPGGILPPEKKRVLPPQSPAKSTGRLLGNEPNPGALWDENGSGRKAAENPSASSLPAAASLFLNPDLPEAAIHLFEFSSPNGGKASTPGETRDGASGSNGSGAKPSANSAAVQAFPSLLNEKVQDFISFFQGRAESFFSRSLARSQAYEEMMKRIFREKNLPEELFYLALIESGYNPTALSHAKASGIWQFIAQTAKRFGLRIDKWVDERRDPEKSTLAAAEYLKTLHEMFNCWDLAAAGYNAGEGKVLGAMKKARSENFWEISKHRYLKQETKHYVPMFLAAMTIAKEPQKYGFYNIEYHPPLVYEKVAVPPSSSLALIAKAAETDLAEIRSLNPALLREKTPPNSPLFEIKLPPGKKEVFEKNFPSLSRSAESKNTHRIRSGETLSLLAKKYNVSVQELCQANSLTLRSVLKPGSTLKIPQ
jgi:LysM repeat protein